MVGQVQQQSKNNEIDACGVTVSAMEVRTGPPSGTLLIFNGSIMIYGPEGGLVKGRASELDARLMATGKYDLSTLKPLRTISTWMKAPAKPLTAPIAGTGVKDAEDRGYRIYASDFDAVFGVITAVIERQVIQIGMKTQGTTDRILFGKVELSDAEHEQLLACMREWSATMNKRYKLDEKGSSGENSSGGK